MFKRNYLLRFLPGIFALRMADESPTVVVVETPAEEPEEKTVTEQAAEMVDTAKDLAKEIAKPEEVIMALEGFRNDIINALADAVSRNDERHAEILARLDEIRNMEILQQIENDADEGEVEEVAAAAVDVAEAAAETAQAVPEVTAAAVEVAEEPKKREKSRRWI